VVRVERGRVRAGLQVHQEVLAVRVVLAVQVGHRKVAVEVAELEKDQEEGRTEDRSEGREDHDTSLEYLEMNHEVYRSDRPDLCREAGIDPCRRLPSAGIERTSDCATVSGNETPGEE
jgi:hypothetical protein